MKTLQCRMLLCFLFINSQLLVYKTSENSAYLYIAKDIEALFCDDEPAWNPTTSLPMTPRTPPPPEFTSPPWFTPGQFVTPPEFTPPPWFTPAEFVTPTELPSLPDSTTTGTMTPLNYSQTTTQESTILMTDRAEVPSLLVLPPQFRHPPCCNKCSNNITNCKIENNCCLGAFEELPTIDESESRVQMTCDYSQMKSYKNVGQANAPIKVNMIRRCPKDAISYVTIDVIQQCETTDVNPQKTSLLDIIPVKDNVTSYTYKNKYCAQCNSIPKDKLVYWSPFVKCKDSDIQLETIDDIIRDVMNSKDCNIVFDIPRDGMTKLPICIPGIISTCNQTGHWKIYNSFIERACLAYTKIYDFVYRNVFCYMCNTYDTEAPNYCIPPSQPTDFYSFSALINARPNADGSSEATNDGGQCTRNEMFDPSMGHCREVTCQFPKTFSNGVCINMVNSVGGVIFDVYFELTPRDRIGAHMFLAMISRKLPTYFMSELEALGLNGNHITTQTVAVKTREETNTDDVNTRQPILEKIVFYVQMTFAIEYPVSILDDIMLLENKNIELREEPLFKINFTVELSHWHRGTESIIDIRTRETLRTISHTAVTDVTALPGGYLFLKETPTTYHLTEFSLCPLVSLHNITVYNDINSHGEVHLLPYDAFLNQSDIFLLFTKVNLSCIDTEFYDVSVQVCLETFDHITAAFNGSKRCGNGECDDKKDDIIIIVSFICIVLSMFSALCTFVVYCIFKELRTQPGINNMILALYMFIAQALFQFGYGSREDVSAIACTIIGVCVHFAWLAFAMWMNVCCIHMFRVFRSTIIIQTKDNNKLRVTFFYTLYCWCFASLPVIIHVVLSYFKTNGRDIGYGRAICYISPWQYEYYLVTAPIVSIVTVDVILYIVVLVQIRRSSGRFEQQKETRNLLKIYFRLSTITGGTWLLALVYLFTNTMWAEYLFVLANASQGVFLFLAFVVNRRVLNLVRSLCQPTSGFRMSRKCNTIESNKTGSSKSDTKSTGSGSFAYSENLS